MVRLDYTTISCYDPSTPNQTHQLYLSLYNSVSGTKKTRHFSFILSPLSFFTPATMGLFLSFQQWSKKYN